MKRTYKPTEEDWTAILSISHRLLFDDVHQHAIEELTKHIETMDPIKQLLLSKEHSIHEWRTPAYVKLVEQSGRLTLEIAQRLTLEDVLLIDTCRELYYHKDNWRVSLFKLPDEVDILGFSIVNGR
jgi:hypothetical protein